MGALYDALRQAPNIPEEAARAAAEEVANYEHRIARIESDLTLLKWMVGTNVALTIAILVRVFTIS
jgi:hypothetical protein